VKLKIRRPSGKSCGRDERKAERNREARFSSKERKRSEQGGGEVKREMMSVLPGEKGAGGGKYLQNRFPKGRMEGKRDNIGERGVGGGVVISELVDVSKGGEKPKKGAGGVTAPGRKGERGEKKNWQTPITLLGRGTLRDDREESRRREELATWVERGLEKAAYATPCFSRVYREFERGKESPRRKI